MNCFERNGPSAEEGAPGAPAFGGLLLPAGVWLTGSEDSTPQEARRSYAIAVLSRREELVPLDRRL